MQTKKILALDVSKSSTGYAVIIVKEDSSVSIEAKGSFPFRNSRSFYDEISDLIQDYEIDHATYSDTVNFRLNGKTAMILCKIFGQAEMILDLSGIGVTVITDKEAKSYLGLPSSPRAVAKQASQDYAKNEWKIDTKNDDEADAIVFGVYFVKKYC